MDTVMERSAELTFGAFEGADDVVDAEPAPAQLPALQTLREHSLAELSAVERGLAKLRLEHGSTDYDITTPHGYRLATTRRHAIRLVRYQVPKVVKAKRAELNEIRDALASEGERIVAALQAIEEPHHALIEAEDARRAAERAERERKDVERRARHEANLAGTRADYALAWKQIDKTFGRMAMNRVDSTMIARYVNVERAASPRRAVIEKALMSNLFRHGITLGVCTTPPSASRCPSPSHAPWRRGPPCCVPSWAG
jgi:hypothetical protein